MAKAQHPFTLTFALAFAGLIALTVFLLVWGKSFAPPAPPKPLFEVDDPTGTVTTTPLPIGHVGGRADVYDTLEVGIEEGGRRTTLEIRRRDLPALGFYSLGLDRSARKHAFEEEGQPSDAEIVWVALEVANAPLPPPVAWPLETLTSYAGHEATRTALMSGLPPISRTDVVFAEDPTDSMLLAIVRRAESHGRIDGGTLASCVAHLTRQVGDGDLRFLIEIPPPPADTEGRGSDAPETFQAFKVAEVARFLEARDAGRSYMPSRSDRLVLPRAETPGREPEDFVVLELPPPDLRLDRRMVHSAQWGRLEEPVTVEMIKREAARATGSGVDLDWVTCEIAGTWQERLEAFTTANLGRTMAVILDGRILTTMVLREGARERLQIPFTSLPGRRAAVRAADQLIEILRRGSRGRVLPTTLIAIVDWRRSGGAFEVLVPLPPEGETRVTLRATNQASGPDATPPPPVDRVFLRRAGADVELDDAAASLLAAVDLGILSEEQALERLQPHAAHLESLGRIAREEGRPYRTTAATRLLGYADPDDPGTWQALTEAAQGTDRRTRCAVIMAIKQLGRRSPAAADRSAEQVLRPLLADADPTVRDLATRAPRAWDGEH